MKIAVCLSGQIRTGVIASVTHLNFLKNYDVDFFIHTWTTESISPNGLDGHNMTHDPHALYPVSEEKLSKIHDIYKPKLISVTSIDEGITWYIRNFSKQFGSFTKDITSDRYGTRANPQFVSNYIVNALKTNYAQFNNIEYDYVLKIRFDSVFRKDHYLDEEIEYININGLKHTLYTSDDNNKLLRCESCLRTEDIFWIGDNATMDIAMKFADGRAQGHQYQQKDWQCELTHFLKDHNLDIKAIKRNTVYIYRFYHEDEGVDPFNEEKIHFNDFTPV